MKGNSSLAFIAVVALAIAAQAGTISGKVSGVAGESVVYVDTIAGKTFPAPDTHPLMDQKGLTFQPHIIAVQQGTTVDFLNSDSVAHNVFWISARGPKARNVRSSSIIQARCRCCAMFTRRCRATLWYRRLPTTLSATSQGTTRSKACPTARTR